MIGKWVIIDGKPVQIIQKQPTHPEGKIWTAIALNEEVTYITDNDLKLANNAKQTTDHNQRTN